MKCARYLFTFIIGMEATDRILQRMGIKRGRGRRDPLEMTRHELMDELRRLRRHNDAWEEWHVAHESHVEDHGGPCYVGRKPECDEPASSPLSDPASNS